MLDDLEHVTNIELALAASKSKKIWEEINMGRNVPDIPPDSKRKR